MSLLAANHVEVPSCCLLRPGHLRSDVHAVVQCLIRCSPVPSAVFCRLPLVRGSRLWRRDVPSLIITEFWSDPDKLTRQVMHDLGTGPD